jgi:excisionase family DNA binding protein
MSAARKYLRAVEIVAMTGISLRTVRRWIADEVVPSTKLGGARLVAMADLKSVLSGFCEGPQDSPEEGEEIDAES